MKFLTKLNSVNLESIKNDIILNKKLTNKSESNMYEILFDCENFNKCFNFFLQNIKEVNEVYVKNMWGYVQDTQNQKKINFDINFKNDLNLVSDYSFIYIIKPSTTNVILKSDNNKFDNFYLEEGSFCIFNTKDFYKEESLNTNRVALVGSIYQVKSEHTISKKLL